MDPFVIKIQDSKIKNSKIKKNSFDVDGDILVSDSFRKHPRHNWAKFKNSSILFYICFFLFTSLFSKLYYLQIVRGADYYGEAEINRIRPQSILAPRGVIFDSNGEKLAYNIPNFGLYVIPADLPKEQDEEDEILKTISEIIGIDHFDLVSAFSGVPRTSVLNYEITRGLTQEQVVQIESSIKNWQGISIRVVEKRAYSIVEPFSHILGYTGKISESEYKNMRSKGYLLPEHTGKSGIEKVYQEELRGEPGIRYVEVDSLGREINVLGQKDTIPGSNIYLNIDSKLQMFAWEALKEEIDNLGVGGGSVVILDPRNGAIRALVSYPGYDNQSFSDGISQEQYKIFLDDERKPLFNRSIAGEYPSGSTFKIIVASAGLEEGIITRNTSYLSTGGIRVGIYYFPDWRAGGHGQTNVIKALAESVNTFFYILGGGLDGNVGLGVENITKYAKLFGLSKNTSIDLTGERSGFLPSKEWKLETRGERWYLGNTYHYAIGQGDILVTPLQLANATAAIANNGTLYEPRVAKEFVTYDGKKVEVEPKIILEKIISSSSLGIVREGMRSAVTTGSARSLSLLSVPVAGKTGTAQFSSTKKPHAWFTGFGPYNNPEIVITVLVEEGEEGSRVATPVARKIFEWYFEKEENK